MKTYYSMQGSSARQSLVKGFGESLSVLACVGAFCAAIWLAKGQPSREHLAPAVAEHRVQ